MELEQTHPCFERFLIKGPLVSCFLDSIFFSKCPQKPDASCNKNFYSKIKFWEMFLLISSHFLRSLRVLRKKVVIFAFYQSKV